MFIEETILARLSTKGIDGPAVTTIVLATAAGMGLMFITIMLRLPILVSMIALIGGIMLVLGTKGGHMTYQLTEKGIYRVYKPFLAKWFFEKQERRDLFIFSEIDSYKLSKDLNRSGKEVETLRILISRKPYTLAINDEVNPADFRTFCEQFVRVVEQKNAAIADTPNDWAEPSDGSRRPITRKKGFYRTIWAKLLTVVFMLIAVGIVVLYFMEILNWKHLFELLILIPGILYMYKRSFGKEA